MKPHQKVRKAIFPVAGLGTRFLPATKASPKEMLSVVNKPLIQYAVEEAYESGIREMIFVTSSQKFSIEDHFDTAYHLENELALHHKDELLSIVQAVKPDDMECFYVRQNRLFGLGHAILCAETLIDNEPFAVLLADDLMIGKEPVLKQLINQYNINLCSILAVQTVPKKMIPQYGIIKIRNKIDNLIEIESLKEKPNIEEADSNIAVVGRYILTPTIFKYIKNITKTSDHVNEIQLTDAVNMMLKQEPVMAYIFEGQRYDCGSILGFLQANVVLGKIHPNAGKPFSKWLKKLNDAS